MIDHQRQIGTSFSDGGHVFQVSRVDEEIVRKSACGELFQTCQDRWSNKPIVVRFAFDEVADAFEFWIAAEFV